MTAVRWIGESTNASLNAILGLMSDPQCTRVLLFASPRSNPGPNDGSDANLPLVAALAEFVLPGVKQIIDVVFDGLFLTAARDPRRYEVKQLLDAAIASNKAYYCTSTVPFTSSLSPDQAAGKLKTAQPLNQLDAATRTRYFALLSAAPEAMTA